MDFEWDDLKNRDNIRKHHLSFADACEVFEQPLLVDVDSRTEYGETRYIAIGLLRGNSRRFSFYREK
jgi:uncharacterized protein